ncbi:hypothetical protein [[Muricauda] lutisoli]|uniref:Uncharacterized protein n=1 Tax=[Muricauda] lutisoli TaxID=2816035 RepID=A0ABS3EWT3_9FLAO|nr:hypothetical protein [[Muricauda] lutisoli]MBO0330688.1 hypothetical protein [[Muricauda] lutisoli]
MNETQITELTDWINDCCGTPEILGNYLDLTVEMLFYVKLGSFEQQEIQNVVTILRGLKRILDKKVQV